MAADVNNTVLDVLKEIRQEISVLTARQNDVIDRVATLRGETEANVQRLLGAFAENIGVRCSPALGTAGKPRLEGSFSDLSASGENRFSQSPVGSPAARLPSPPAQDDLASSGSAPRATSLFQHRVVLTTYPGQIGVKPIQLHWGHPDPISRGAIIASRHPGSIKIRNAIGAYGGSYSVYRALSVASGELPAAHMPDLRNTEPPVTLRQNKSWGDPNKIVSLDPFGHIVQLAYKKHLDDGIDVRPSIAITKAHMRIPEIEAAVSKGVLKVDGNVVLNPSGELRVVKAAVEPVWYLPGVAHRFGVDESVLRRSLFEETGGMYPELITRSDLKVFFPPIGGLTVYIFGPVENVSDPSKKLTLRVHDECNGSDVFGSDICTCRPYLIFGIEQCVKAAQEGGSGVIVYFRKEGRALGEVTKYLVYNARKRGGDLASSYFQRTENVAGVKDARFQALMPDVLHWLGIQKIDRMMSMSNMKHDAIVDSGIKILERVPIPDELIPADSRVEIDAKIAAGYFSDKRVVNEDLERVAGRNWQWDELQH